MVGTCEDGDVIPTPEDLASLAAMGLHLGTVADDAVTLVRVRPA